MRLARLSLSRFGPFTDVELDLGPPGVLTLVVGPNEAGKSTALRALVGLLFGIDERTVDAHLHAPKDLRLGGELIDASGCVLSVVRRKGRKNTLTTPGGEAIDDAALEGMLGGLTREAYLRGFAIDHARLREGGDALLRGGGEVGQTLFDASRGGRSVQRVLERLKGRAEEIFTPRSRTKTLNEALARHTAAREALRDQLHDSDAYVVQERAVAERRASLQALDGARRALSLERERLTRARRVLPMLAERARKRAELEALGPLPLLPSSTRERRVALELELESIRPRRELVALELERKGAALAGLGAPEPLAEVAAQAVQALADRAAVLTRDLPQLPALRARRAELEDERTRALARLEVPAAADARRFELSAAAEARLRELSRAPERPDAVEADVAHAAERVARLRAELEGLQLGTGRAELGWALEDAKRRSPGERLLALEREAQALRDAERDLLRALSPWAGTAAALADLPLPAEEWLERWGAERERLAREVDAHAELRAALEVRLRGAERELLALIAASAVPSEAELSALRQQRDRLLTGLLEGEGPLPRSALAPLPAAVRAADETADRLRREAERVSRRAALEADIAEARTAQTRAEGRAAELASREQQWTAVWSSSLPHPSLGSLSVAELRRWAERARAARAAVDARLAKQHEVDQARREVGALRDRLAALLGEGEGAELEALLAKAEARSQQLANVAARRVEVEARLAAAVETQAELEARLGRARAEYDAWQRAWSASVAALGLGDLPTPEEVAVVLEQARALFELEREAERVDAQLERTETESRTLLVDAQALAASAGVGAEAKDGVTLVAMLQKRHAEAVARRDRRLEVAADLERARAEAAELAERERAAQAALAALLLECGVASREALLEAEARVENHTRLEQELARVERELDEAGDGRTSDELQRETRDLDADLARVRLHELDTELEELDLERQAAVGAIKDAEHGLSRFHEQTAVDAAEHLELTRHAVLEQAALYVRLTVARGVLAREIERFREENQGPLVGRAARLFAQLTALRYPQLRVEHLDGEQPVLLAVRQDEVTHSLSELSEGTADQLYLALRLASYEHFIARGEPLPLVLDDVLVTFDEARARAALRVLAELARQTQVLLFSHHEHLLTLAETTLEPGQYHVRRLARREVSACGAESAPGVAHTAGHPESG